MENFGFSDSKGDEITRGKQFATASDARAYAQRLANRRDENIEFWNESSPEEECGIVTPDSERLSP